MAILLIAQGRLWLPAVADDPAVASVGLGRIGAGVVLMNLAMAAGRSFDHSSYTMPLWVAVLMAVVFQRLPTQPEAIGVFLGLVGITILINPFSIAWQDAPVVLLGSVLLVGSAAINAAVLIHVRGHRGRCRSHAMPMRSRVAANGTTFADARGAYSPIDAR
jgi:drug/metabolite transporter (DMT)-like permease